MRKFVNSNVMEKLRQSRNEGRLSRARKPKEKLQLSTPANLNVAQQDIDTLCIMIDSLDEFAGI